MANTSNHQIDKLQLKLKCNSTMAQFQGVQKLKLLILAEKCPLPITERSKSIPVNFLIECCCHEHATIADESVNLLLNLCESGVIYRSYAITSSVNLSSLKRNTQCLVRLVVNLLKQDILDSLENSTKVLQCYQGKWNSHPLVSIMRNCPESLHSILHYIKVLMINELNDGSERFQSLIIKQFGPLLVHLSSHSNGKSQTIMKAAMLHIILDVAESLLKNQEERACQVVKIGFAIIRACEMNKANLEETIFYTQILSKWIACNCSNGTLLCGSVDVLLDQCINAAKFGIDATYHIHTICSLLRKDIQIANRDSFSFSLLMLLSTCPPSWFLETLQFVSFVLGSCHKAKCLHPSTIVFVPTLLCTASKYGSHSPIVTRLSTNIVNNILLCHSINQESKQNTSMEMQFVWSESMHKNAEDCKLFRHLLESETFTRQWLTCISREVSCGKTLDVGQWNIILSLLICPFDAETKLSALNLLAEASLKDPDLILDFLPLLLHVLHTDSSDKLKKEILYTLPVMSSSKHVVSPVLGLLQNLASNSQILPVILRVTYFLWKKQPRVFTHLHKMLTTAIMQQASIPSQTGEELIISRATVIMDICRYNPLHGKELIKMIWKMITLCSRQLSNGISDANAFALCCCLRSLQHLISNEIVGLVDIWNSLPSSIKQCNHDAIEHSVCKLLGVATELSSFDESNRIFKQEVIQILWSKTFEQKPLVISSALESISTFDISELIIGDLPAKVHMSLYPDNDVPKDTPIPPSFYLQLYNILPKSCYPALETLIRKVLNDEFEHMPRGIGRKSKIKMSCMNKNLSTIPQFMYQMYNNLSNPGLGAVLSGSMLQCYAGNEMPDEPGRRHYIANADAYRRMLGNILNEMLFDSGDWFSCCTISTSWNYFMQKVFNAVADGRKAELSLQFERKEINNESYEESLSSSWLWTRDDLLELLKTTSRGNSSVQGNTLIALAALTNASYAYEEDLTHTNDSSVVNENQQFISNRQFTCKVADTLMVVYDGNYKPANEPFIWSQQVSSHKSTASSMKARACAAIAMQQISVLQAKFDVDRVNQMVTLLIERLPGKPRAGTSCAMHFYTSVAFGLMMFTLCANSLAHLIAGQIISNETFSSLQSYLKTDETESRRGVGICLGLSATGMLYSEDEDVQFRATSILNFLHSHLIKAMEENVEFDDSLLSVAFGYMFTVSSAFMHHNISWEEGVNACSILEKIAMTHTENKRANVIFGSFVYTMVNLGLTSIHGTYNSLLNTWKNNLESEGNRRMKAASIGGLLALIGCQNSLLKVPLSDIMNDITQSQTSEIVHTLKELIKSSNAFEICDVSYQSLASLYLSSVIVEDRRSMLPIDLSYLGSLSCLNVLFGHLQQSCSGVADITVVESIIKVISSASIKNMPPCNWKDVLAPLMKLKLSDCIETLLVKLSLGFMGHPTNTQSCLREWLQPTIFTVFNVTSQVKMFEDMSVILRNSPQGSFSDLMVKIIKHSFQTKKIKPTNQKTKMLAVIKGLNALLHSGPQTKAILQFCYTVWTILLSHVADCGGYAELKVSTSTEIKQCFAKMTPDQLQQLFQFTINIGSNSIETICLLLENAKIPFDSTMALILETSTKFNGNSDNMVLFSVAIRRNFINQPIVNQLTMVEKILQYVLTSPIESIEGALWLLQCVLFNENSNACPLPPCNVDYTLCAINMHETNLSSAFKSSLSSLPIKDKVYPLLEKLLNIVKATKGKLKYSLMGWLLLIDPLRSLEDIPDIYCY